ncbi:unnamed protein product [Paramecium primaurelia]|uniref:Transmembrane protein n=1 Tax=Paramecium primaurelia TaxID=5886 RepID=A0A8S1MTG9_PARPR|nr:unnamed protein product [Paramecium primaurelia]
MTDIQDQIETSERANEIQQEQRAYGNSCTKNKDEQKYFYRLILAQLIVIFISTFLPTKKYFFNSIITYPRSNITFDEYCKTYEKCRQNYYYFNSQYYQQDLNQYEVWKNSVVQDQTEYKTLYYFSLILLPSLLIIQSVFRNCQLFKNQQKMFYYLQYPSMSLFIQVFSHLIKQGENKNIFYNLRILILYQIGIVTFFYLNQKFLKWQLELKSTIQKLVNYSFIIICLKEILNFFGLTQSNWIPHIIFILYTQVYLLHLNTNLFKENNRYIIHNQSALQLIKQKLQSLFVVQDDYREVAENYFVISKKKMYSWIFGIILSMVFRDYIFNLQNFIVLSGIFVIFVWDTSLVSTSSKFTLKDQYQAASLFILDFMLPIRNIILRLLV